MRWLSRIRRPRTVGVTEGTLRRGGRDIAKECAHRRVIRVSHGLFNTARWASRRTVRGMNDFNARVIEEFRSNGGRVVESGPFGRTLVLLVGEKPFGSPASLELDADEAGAVHSASVRVSELAGEERSAAWERFVAAAPMFGEYQVKAGDRLIPLFTLTLAE